MGTFLPIKYDEDHKKKWDEFTNDYEALAKKIETLLPQVRERKRAFERLTESFCWVGRTLRTSQIKGYAKAEKEHQRIQESCELPKEEIPATSTKRILILKKSA